MFAVIHNFANRRVSVRGDLNKIKIEFVGHFNGFFYREDGMFIVGLDHTYYISPYILIDPFFGYGFSNGVAFKSFSDGCISFFFLNKSAGQTASGTSGGTSVAWPKTA